MQGARTTLMITINTKLRRIHGNPNILLIRYLLRGNIRSRDMQLIMVGLNNAPVPVGCALVEIQFIINYTGIGTTDIGRV